MEEEDNKNEHREEKEKYNEIKQNTNQNNEKNNEFKQDKNDNSEDKQDINENNENENETNNNKEVNEDENDYIYFIVSFNENNEIELTLSENYNLQKKLDKDENQNIIIYSFRNIDKKEKIKINQKDSFYELEIKDPKRNFFDYDFKLKNDNINDLSYEEKFKIYYNNIFKDKDKNKSSQIFEDFVLSSQLILKRQKEYNFSFYLLIFNIIYNNAEFLEEHLKLFDLEKIKKNVWNLSEEDIEQSKEIFNNIIPKDKIIENEKNSKKTKELYYSFLLFFNLKYQPDIIIEMFENKDINDNDFLYKKFIEIIHFDSELKPLPENHIVNILKNAEKEEDILYLLNYIEKDILKFFQIINEAKPKLESKVIDINKYLDINIVIDNTIKNSEYLNSILEEIKELEKNYNLKLFEFSKLIETIIECNKDNIENLIIIRDIINEIKKSNETFIYSNDNNDINLLIHDKIKYEGLDNLDLLNTIEIDEIYKNNDYKSKRTLDIFNGIDISKVDEQFFKKWKEMNFKKVFEPNELYEKIASLVEEFKFIEKLFLFFDKDDNDFNRYIEDTFQKILENKKNNLNENDILDIFNLIDFIEKNKHENMEKYFEIIQTVLNFENNEKLEDNNFCENCKKLIVQYLIKDINTTEEILELINKFSKIKQYILNEIEDFIIKEEDLEDESENKNKKFEFLKQQLDIFQGNQFIETNYYIETKKAIDNIKKNLEDYKIKYKTLKNNEEILEERLNFIKLDNQIGNEIENYLQLIKSKFKQIDEDVKKLEDIKEYLNTFFKVSGDEKIKDIEEILKSYEELTLIDIDEKIKNYNNYYNDAKEVLRMNKCKFFNNIYDSHKEIEDEEKRLNKTREKFDSLKKIFDDSGILDFDENLLKVCFKDLGEIELEKYIKQLEEIFGIKNDNRLILERLKEKYIFKALLKIIKNYKEQIDNNKNKGENECCKIDINNKNKEEINRCEKELKDLNLDIDEQYQMLNKLNEQWEIILILSIDNFNISDNNNIKEKYIINCYNLVQKINIKQSEEELNNELVPLFKDYINEEKNVLNDFIQLIDKNNNNYLFNALFNDDNKIYENFILPLEHIKILSDSNKIEIDINKEKWDKLIHNSILNSVKENKLKTSALLEMMKIDKIYNNDKYKDLRDLDIFNGIVISELNDDFFNKWKEMNFISIFHSNLKNFFNKITSLVDDLKSFEKLFLFFDNNDEFDNTIEKKFKAMLKDKNNIDENDIINFVLYMDKKQNKNFEKFLEIIQEELYFDKTEEIYLKLESNYNISKDCKDLITQFLIQKKSANDIFNLVNKCKNIKENILNEIKEDFIIKETFLEDENENEDYKLLKQLNSFLEDDKFDKTNYIKNTKNIIEIIKGDLKKYKIKYDTLDIKEKKEKLIERLKCIYLNDEIKNIDSKFNFLKSEITKLKIIQKYLNIFFKDSKNEEKEKIKNILKSKYLNEIEDKIKEYPNYINDYNEAQEVLKKNENKIFKRIYDSYSYKDYKDEELLKKTIDEFQSLDKLFKDNEFLDIDDEVLKKCFNTSVKDERENEIEELGKIFKHENISSSDIIEKLKEKYIFKALLSLIKNYKDQIDKIKDIKENECCKIVKNKNIIEDCQNKLNELNLELNEKYEILNNLNEHWEIILILFNDKFNFDNNSNNEEEKCVKNCYNLVQKSIKLSEKEFGKEMVILFKKYINKEKNVLNDFIQIIEKNYLYNILFNNNNNISKNFILPKEHIKILADNNKTKIGNNEEKWDELIYKSILESARDRKLENEELLKRIKNYKIYNENRCKTLKDDDLEIFNGIDLSSFPQDKYKDFKSIQFEEKFKSISKKFYARIDSLIKELKDFNFIFYCFNIQAQDPNLDPIKGNFKKLLDDKVEKNHYVNLVELLNSVTVEENLKFIKETIENNSNCKKIYNEVLKNAKPKINEKLETYIKDYLKKKKIESFCFWSIIILLLSFIFGYIFEKKYIPNNEYNPNEINWNIYNISKEAKFEEKQYNYIEIKNKKIQKLPEREDKIIVGIDFGTISTGYSFVEKNDINNINLNGKSPNEIETSKDSQNGKKYSERASVSLQNYNTEELSNINFVKGIKTIFTLDKFNNDNLCYVYPSEYVSNFNVKNIIREYFIMLKKDILENINAPRNKKDKIRWIISIPTAWKEFNKQIILNAAYESGMSNARLLYENEAASLSMLNDKYIPDKNKNKNTVFMLVSLGGYFSNITINEIVDKETVKEKEFIKNNVIVENVGVLTISQEIIQVLENIFGKNNVDKAKREDPGEWVKTLKDINEAIRNTYSLDGIQIFKINTVFKKKGEFEYLYKTEDNEKRYIIKNSVDLEFPSGIISNIILKNINIIINHIDNIMKEMKSKRIRIDSIVLTGGLSKNKIVQNEIESKFSKTSVNYLSATDYAISKGAVFYGINPNRIKSRMSPETLGIRKKEDGKDNIEILVKRGQEVENYSMIKFIKPSSKIQDRIQINVYASNTDNLNENDFIGRLMIFLDNNKKEGLIQLNINYDTVLSFSAIEYDNKNEIKTKFEIVK